MEEWRDIPGFAYQISSLGRVKSLNATARRKAQDGILKPSTGKRGYLCVGLHKDKSVKYKYIHRLIAEAFIPNPDNKCDVDHINRDRLDNRIENLRWATRKENMQNNGREHNYVSGPFWKVAVPGFNVKMFRSEEEAIKFKDSLLLPTPTDPLPDDKDE